MDKRSDMQGRPVDPEQPDRHAGGGTWGSLDDDRAGRPSRGGTWEGPGGEAATDNANDRAWDPVVRSGTSMVALGSLIVGIGMFVLLAIESLPYLFDHPPGAAPLDVGPILVVALRVAAVAIAVGLPLGVAGAVWTSELAPRWAGDIIKPVVEFLALIPAVVLGVMAMTAMGPGMTGASSHDPRATTLAAGLSVGLAIALTVHAVAQDGMRAVPDSLREAAHALGADRSLTAFRVVLPAALPAIGAAGIIGLARAVGEVLVVLVAFKGATLPAAGILSPLRTLVEVAPQGGASQIASATNLNVLLATLLVSWMLCLRALGLFSTRQLRLRLRRSLWRQTEVSSW